ncbi:response regulator [Vibrio fluvialis]|nr:response regulator [Vibrio fluvialis]
MEQEKIEQLNEALVELERSKEREQRLAEENRVILAALSALSHADNKYQIFEELKKVLSRYIRFDDFIINDILDLSRIESGHFELQRHWISLSKKLQHALEYHSQVAQAKDIKFNVKASICEQFEYWVDSVRLTQILFNIIGNAIKFTHQGFVDVSLVTARDRLEIEVRDSGIGIDNERIEHLFSPFIQADTSITRNYGGTGLGLAITKHLVELMGGTIKVNSKLGEGSLFTISIPLESRSTAAANENAGQLSDTKTYDALDNSKHILVVEDTKTNQMVIQLLLNRMGYSVTIANNGQHALELIEKNRSFDLIFMDISMPIMDGIQATRILRSQRLTTPIIALTAHSMNSDHQNCLAAGMNDIVLKPIRSKELQRISDRYLNRR